MRIKVMGAVVAVLLAVGVAGCGDSSDASSAAELRAQASTICRDVERRVQTLRMSATEATLRSSLARTADAMGEGLDRLEAIEPPDALADRYDAFLAWMGTQRDAAQALATSDAGSAAAAEGLSARERRVLDPHVDVLGRLARGLGLPDCA